MQIYKFGWVILPLSIYFMFKKYYILTGQMWLLIYTNILLLSSFLPSWLMQIVHLIIITAMSVQLLLLCKQTGGIIAEKNLNSFYRIIFRLQEQLSIFVYVISLWVILRVYTNKNRYFKLEIKQNNNQNFQSLLTTLSGWNCTSFQYFLVPLIWLLLNIISYFVGNLIIRLQQKNDNLYKEYLIKYKVLPDTILSIIVFLYSLYSFLNAFSLVQCTIYWKNGYLYHFALYYGYSITTLYFLSKTKGVFQVESDSNFSNKSQNENVNQRQIDMVKFN